MEVSSVPVFARVRRLFSLRDLAGYLAAAAFGAVSLTYPFGRDQGLYFYIGREWWERGSLPYRDAFDVKTPGIYLLNALSYAWFGHAQWGIRVFDLLAVGAIGWLAARCATPTGTAVRPGLAGVATLAAALCYYGHFDYWHTAQCEIHCSAFALLAIAIARGLPRGAVPAQAAQTAVLAGLATGVAALFKPPALLLCALGFALLLERVWSGGQGWRVHLRGSVFATLGFAVGVVVVPVAIIAYFALAGGLAELYDVLVVNNRHYVVHGRWANSFEEVVWHMRDGYRSFDPMITMLWVALLVTTVHALWRRERDTAIRRATPLLLLLAAGGIVLAQMKFVHYHWGGFGGPLALGTAVLVHDASEWIERAPPSMPGSRRGHAGVVQLAAGSLAAILFTASGADFIAWAENVRGALRYHQGLEEREVFLQRFTLEKPYHYAPARLEQIGTWLCEHTSPDDLLAVRGFEPEMYLLAERRFNGRFFWTTFLSTPSWAYRMEDWIAEDRRVFERAPPRWVLALEWVKTGVDSPAYFEALGYVRAHELRPFVLMEHWALKQPPVPRDF